MSKIDKWFEYYDEKMLEVENHTDLDYKEQANICAEYADEKTGVKKKEDWFITEK